MNLPIFYEGFFRTEEKEMLKIYTIQHITDIKKVKANELWLYGRVMIEEGGNVTVDVERAYEIFYSWDSFSVERGKEIENLVYIDDPVTVKTWFGLSSKTYHPPSTRYIIDKTGKVVPSRKYVNVPVVIRAH